MPKWQMYNREMRSLVSQIFTKSVDMEQFDQYLELEMELLELFVYWEFLNKTTKLSFVTNQKWTETPNHYYIKNRFKYINYSIILA